MGSYINKDNLCSESLIKDVLTVYSEGLACNNVHKRKLYKARRYAKDKWCALKQSAGEIGEPKVQIT